MISFTAEQRFIVTGASSGIGEGVALLLDVPMTVAQDAWDIPQSKLVNFGQVPPEKLSTTNLDMKRQNVINAQIRAMMATPQ